MTWLSGPGKRRPLSFGAGSLPDRKEAEDWSATASIWGEFASWVLEFLEAYAPRESDCRPTRGRNSATAIAVFPWPTSSACLDSRAWNRQSQVASDSRRIRPESATVREAIDAANKLDEEPPMFANAGRLSPNW